MSFVVHNNVFCRLEQCLLSSTAVSFVVCNNVLCRLQKCLLSSTTISFVVYNNVLCHLQQCLLPFITHCVKAAPLNYPWILDVADRYTVLLSPEKCSLDWLTIYLSIGGICCLSRVEKWGSIFSDVDTYRRHYTVPTSEGGIVHYLFRNNFHSHSTGKRSAYLLTV